MVHKRKEFLDVIWQNVKKKRDELLYAWLNDRGDVTRELSYKQVWKHANNIALHLHQDRNLRTGDRVILCYDFSLDFIQAFLGCLIAGVVAVPIYPPNPGRLAYRKFTCNIWKLKLKLGRKWPVISWVNSDEIKLHTNSEHFGRCYHDIKDKEDKDTMNNTSGLAFLQYTSGSTGDPKGVMITYANLIHNLNLTSVCAGRRFRARGMDEGNRAMCWLPQYHDMGLILCYLRTPFVGGSGYFMSPFSFLKSPPLWLHSFWRYNCNYSFVPNFAFDLVLRKWRNLPVPDGFDLKMIDYIGAGGEENQRKTFENFENFFCSQFQLPKQTIVSCYGMAEHVVSINCDPCVRRRSYSKRDPRRVCCGIWDEELARIGSKCRIVDAETCRVVKDGSEGEIWVQSPSVTMGYWGNKEKTVATFQAKITQASSSETGNWLRTGDVGYMEKEHLYFVSRIKDLIIIRGKNYAPKDLETAADVVIGVRPGCTIVFSIPGKGGTEEAVMVSEVRHKNELNRLGVTLAGIATNLKIAVKSSEGVRLKDVVLIKERTLPKTSSGKLRRSEARKLYLGKSLQTIYWPGESWFAVKQITDVQSTKVAETDDFKFHSVDSQLDFKEALNIALGSGFDWKENGNDEFGSLIDSLQLVEIAAALRDSFGLHLASSMMLLRMSPNTLTDMVTSHCLKHCRIHKTLNWQNGTRFLPRDEGSSEACVLTEEMLDGRDFNIEKRHMIQAPLAKDENKLQTDLNWRQQASSDVYEVKKPEMLSENQRSWWYYSLRVVGELFAVASFFFIGSACAIPIYHLGNFASNLSEPWSYINVGIYDQDIQVDATFAVCSARTFGIFLAQVVSLWAVVFSVAVVCLKWIVIGRYTAGKRKFNSLWGFRWWYMDRMLQIWETLIGIFILDTKLIILFYKMLGAKISWTSSIATFLREPDLIEIGANASINGNILCRLFEDRNTLVLGEIKIKKLSKLKANCVVEPNTLIDTNSTVEPNTKVPMGSSLKAGIWYGNPLRYYPKRYKRRHSSAWGQLPLEAIKLATLFFLPILFSFLAVPSIWVFWWIDPFQACLFDNMPHWYAPSIFPLNEKYFLLIFFTTIWVGAALTLIPFTVLLKWLIAGNVKPGIYRPTNFTNWRRWFLGLVTTVIYSYPVSILFGTIQSTNLFLRALGMKVDDGAISINLLLVHIEDAHLVTIEDGAFVSACSFSPDTETLEGYNLKGLIQVGKNCSIGFRTVIEGNVTLESESSVAWMSCIRGSLSLYDDDKMTVVDIKNLRGPETTVKGKMLPESFIERNEENEEELQLESIDLERKLEKCLPNEMKLRVQSGRTYIGHYYQAINQKPQIMMLSKEARTTMEQDEKDLESMSSCEKLLRKVSFCCLISLFGVFTLPFTYLPVVIGYEVASEIGGDIEDPNSYTLTFGLFLLIWAFAVFISHILHKWIFACQLRSETHNIRCFTTLGAQLRFSAVKRVMDFALTVQHTIGHILNGTLLQIFYFRSLGASIDPTALLMTDELLFEMDLIKIGKHAVLDRAQVTGHVFQNFRLKHGETKIGIGTVLGPFSYMNPGFIGPYSRLHSFSKVLNRNIGEHEHWNGVPASRSFGVEGTRNRMILTTSNCTVKDKLVPITSTVTQMSFQNESSLCENNDLKIDSI